MATYIKITPLAAYASSNYAGYPPSAIIDGTNSAWLSLPNTSLAAQFAGVQFSAAKVVRKVVIKFSEYWSNELVIGYSTNQPSAQSGVTRLRTINFANTPNDDLGVAIKVGVDLTFFLDTYPAAAFLTVHPLAATTGPYIGIAEITSYEQGRDIIGDTPKAEGFGYGASSVTSGTGNQVSNAFDASMTSWWLSVLGSQSTQFIFLRPIEDVTSGYIRIRFNSIYGWGDNLRIGYCLPGSVTLANTVNLRTINTVPGATKVYDDNGTLVEVNVDLVFEVPTFPKGAAIVLYPGTGRTAQSQIFTTTSEYVSLNNFEFYGLLAPVVPVDGANPISPNPMPVAPYNVDPVRWKHTVYSTVGEGEFTPDPETTMMFVVLVGGGGGGRVNQNTDGTATEYPANIAGKPTNLFNENGDLVFSAGSGALASTTANVDNLNIVPTNWVKRLDLQWAASIDPGYSEYSGAGAGLNIAGSIPGIPAPMQAGVGEGLSTLLDFTKTAGTAGTGFLAASTSQWARSAALGWQSTNTAHGSFGYVTFAAKTYTAGQQLTFTYGTSSEARYDQLRITINNVDVFTSTADAVGARFIYTIPSTGSYVIQFSYKKDNSGSAGSDRVWVNSVSVPGAGYPQTRGGTSSRAFALTLLPAKYRFNIGAGGTGIPADQVIPESSHGKGGAGGAGGGNGGDGQIIVYEYRGQNLFDPAAPVDKPYTYFDAAVATAIPSFYRTDYYGNGQAVPRTLKHALRPRTRNVLILMCGAGGAAINGSTNVDVSGTIYPVSPTIVKIGDNSYTAGSGTNSTRTGTPTNPFAGRVGAGGKFTSTKEPVYSEDGGGSAYSPRSALSTVGNYGQGAAGLDTTASATDYYAGGSGSLALICITPEELKGTDRILDIQVAQIGRGGSLSYTTGTAGAVLIYETESVLPATITSLTELILRKDVISKTQVSTDSQLILRKDAISKTHVSTDAQLTLRKDTQAGANVAENAQLLLLKETSVNDMQVKHINLAVVYDFDEPRTAISTDAELVLTKSITTGSNVSTDVQQILRKDAVAPTRITWSMQSILMRSPLLPTRVSSCPQLLLVAEIASVFFLRFGSLEYPVKNQMYTSLSARATSVPDGAYIQLEGDFIPGTALYINGVNVGLSSPIKNNDVVYIRGGVTNYFQTFINTYTYYTTNGEVTREVCGSWQIIQPDLQAAVSRDYATVANLTWLKTIHTLATLPLVPEKTIASSAYQRFLDMLVSKIHNASIDLAPTATKALAQLIELKTLFSYAAPHLVTLIQDVQKTNPQLHNIVPEFTKMNNVTNGIAIDWERVQQREVYASVSWDNVRANILYIPHSWDRQTALHLPAFNGSVITQSYAQKSNLDTLLGKAEHQTTSQEVEFAKAGQNDQPARTVINVSAYFGDVERDSDMVSGYHTYTLMAPEMDSSNSAYADGEMVVDSGTPGADLADLEIEKRVEDFGTSGLEIEKRVEDAVYVAQEYEYLEKDHAISDTSKYDPISYSRYARYFSVDSLAVSAYSALTDVVPDSVAAGAEFTDTFADSVGADGVHAIPVSFHDQKAKFNSANSVTPIKGAGHNEYYTAIGEVVRFSIGSTSNAVPIKATANYGNFTATSIRNGNNAAFVSANNYIVTKRYTNMHTLTPYRDTQFANGVGKASLYMGFDTKQDALDYTSSYTDVTIQTQFNGFAYNVAVDKSFICEIYFNGPVKWFMQGG